MEAKKNKLFIDCEQAKRICDKAQYQEASWWDRIRLNLRYIYCNITRAYVKKNSKLTNLINDKKVNCMDAKSKASLKENFENELRKQ